MISPEDFITSASAAPANDSSEAIPSYMTAAITHNVASQSESWGDILTLGTEATLVSAGVQLYNILPTIGNWFGGDYELAKTKSVLQDFDTDLGKYYERHQEGVDALGFALSSIVPGTAGIKVLRAGQTMLRGAVESGTLGTNIGNAVGLLAPSQPKLLSSAIEAALKPNAGFPVWNSSTVAAVAAGFGQAALEGAAWETAVAATMYNSPILEKQQLTDIASNIMWGAATFGAIGGVINTASIITKIKSAGRLLDPEAAPFNTVMQPPATFSTSDKILHYMDQYHSTPLVDAANYTGEDAWKASKFESLRQTKLQYLDTKVRELAGDLTKGDETLAQNLYARIKAMSPADTEAKLFSTTEASRVGLYSRTDAEIERIGKQLASGTTFDALSAADQKLYGNSKVVYLKLSGEGAGTVTSDAPVVWNLADGLKDGITIKVTDTGVTAGDRVYKFNDNVDNPWNIFAADHLQTEARQMWAAERTIKDGQLLFENDIPMLDRAYELGVLPKIKQETGKDLLSFINKDEYETWLYNKKFDLAERLRKTAANEAISSDPVTAANKLKQWLGIHFNLSDDPKFYGAMRRVATEDGQLKSILINRNDLTTRPLAALAQTAKHEEGHVIFDVMLDAGLIPETTLSAIREEATAISRRARPDLWASFDPKSVAYRESLHELMADTFSYLSFRPQQAEQLAPTFMQVYGHALRPISPEVADLMIKRAKQLSDPEIAKMVNITEAAHAGSVIKGTDADNMFARQAARKVFEQQREVAATKFPGDFNDQPSWIKFVKDTTPVNDINDNVLTGMAALKQKQVLFENAADAVVADVLGTAANNRVYRISDRDILQANRSGPGGGMLSAQNENYGTLGSLTQNLGANTLKIVRSVQDLTKEELNPTLYALLQKPEAAVEFSVLQSKIRQYAIPWGIDPVEQELKPLEVIRYEKAIAAGNNKVKAPILPEGVPQSLPINNPEVDTLFRQHISLNADRSAKLGNIRAVQGMHWDRDPERIYPIPPNTRDYPFVASVIDDSISGFGHGKMIYAATAQDLEKQITAIKGADPTLKILTKGDAETWYKAIGQYEFERTLTDVTFDSALKMRGVSSTYLPATDPKKIVSDFLNWHLQRDTALVRETVLLKNQAQVDTLRQLGEAYSNVQGSHFTKLDPLAYLEMQGKNPYADYVRSMLGLSTSKEFPFWTPLNDMLDRKVSALFNKVYETFSNAKSPAELASINKMLSGAGYEGAPYSAMMLAQANHTAPKGALSSFIAKANSILSSCMLGLDPINSINNLIGSTVLRNTELNSLIRAINEGNSAVAGRLADLTRIKVPGTEDTVFSPLKMIANAMGDFHSDAGLALRKEFQARGIISSRVEQANWVLNNLALTGKESVQELDGIINKVFATTRAAAAAGEKLTGNTLVEEFNRFVSGHVAKQITDKAVEAGILGEKEAWAYINTFVNRVEGNYIAAQRPGIFQGPVGQAIGLFQTYQFNLMQQLFRHIGEGTVKDAAMMLGLQSTIYGMKGLPAFDAINTHIIGNASGNPSHRDLYDTVYGAVGKEAGDWLMYGMGSNALGLISPDLKMNLYSRGDINPRQISVLPINPADVPFVRASTNFISNLYNTATKIAQGGNVWTSFLQGIEHAGVNRPLAGLAQTLEAVGNPQGRSFSTTRSGNIQASNDFLSLANLIRIAGARPLDEALVMDRVYNHDVYAAKTASLTAALGSTIKTAVIANQSPSSQDIDNFAQIYARAGGRQDQFAQFFMQQYKNANTSQANKLAMDLKSPMSQSMQSVMGGMSLRDFSNTP